MIFASQLSFDYLFGFLESFGHCFPVNDFPNLFEISFSGVFVGDVVSMLPHVNSQKRDTSVVSALVLRSLNADGIALQVVSEPSPAGAFDTAGTLIELSDELFNASKGLDE